MLHLIRPDLHLILHSKEPPKLLLVPSDRNELFRPSFDIEFKQEVFIEIANRLKGDFKTSRGLDFGRISQHMLKQLILRLSDLKCIRGELDPLVKAQSFCPSGRVNSGSFKQTFRLGEFDL